MFRCFALIVLFIIFPPSIIIFAAYWLIRWLYYQALIFIRYIWDLFTVKRIFFLFLAFFGLSFLFSEDTDLASKLFLASIAGLYLLYRWRKRHKIRGGKVPINLGDPDDVNLMSGYEYEKYVKAIVKNQGWRVRLTPKSRDQGADIVARKGIVSVSIQCKKLSRGRVGNEAVQQVYTSMPFYRTAYACVVSNASYTESAKALAASTGVMLLHHVDLPRYLSRLLNK